MEPVTHILTGACLSRTGLNRQAAYTTVAMAIAAELPDIDTLWSLRGPVPGFEHHRGITHTFVALPFEAAIVVGVLCAVHRFRLARHKETTRPLTAAPVRWAWLYGFTLIALLSHLFLDFTNNYGIRPFLPFNPHWYAASIVFIFDPLIFALLLAALIMPSIFRLVGAEVGARRQPFAARGWAIAALLAIIAIWTFRETQHEHALQLAMAQTLAAPATAPADPTAPIDPSQPAPPDAPPVYLQAQRALANPDPFSPFRWYTVTDFGPLYQLGQADSLHGTLDPAQSLEYKLNPSPDLVAAEASPLGRVYLDWSTMPFINITHPGEAFDHTTVQFTDPRFMGDTILLHGSSRSPLTAKVDLDAQHRVILQTMDGKPQK